MKTSIIRTSLRRFTLGLAAIFAMSAPSLHAVTLAQAGYTDQTYGTSSINSSYGNLAISDADDLFRVGGGDQNLYRSLAGSGTFSSYVNVGGGALGLARVGNILYVGVEPQKIMKVDLSAVTPSAVQLGTVADGSPQALVIAPAGWGSHGGKLVIGGNNQLYVMDLTTGVSTQLSNLNRPTSAIAFTPGGVLLATDYNGSSIHQVNPDGTTSVFRTVASGIDGMVIHPSTGKIYTFNSNVGEIHEIAADGSSDVLFASGLSLNGGYYPSAASFSASGDKLFYAMEAGNIRVISGFSALKTSPATAITATSATINGSTVPNGLATTAWFEWGTSPTLVGATSTTAQNVGSGTSIVAFSEPLAGLVPDTTYYFRVVMNNTGGTKYGAILSFITGPEIAVEQPAGTGLTDGAATVGFTPGEVGVAGVAKTVTIKNIGNLDLTGLVLTKDGDHQLDFTVSSLVTTTLAPGASTTFTVNCTPGAIGARSAAIHIASNDSNENPFDITLSGTGTAFAPGYKWAGNTVATASDYYYDYSRGSEFTPIETVQLTHLGVYDHNQDGLVRSMPVKLWNATTQQELASTTVSSGTTDPLIGSSRYHQLTTPVTLVAGTRYIVAAHYQAPNFYGGTAETYGYSTAITTDSRVVYNGQASYTPTTYTYDWYYAYYYGYYYYYYTGNGFYFPSNRSATSTSSAQYFGANFLLDGTLTGAEIAVEHPTGTYLVDGTATAAFSDALISVPSAAKTLPSGMRACHR